MIILLRKLNERSLRASVPPLRRVRIIRPPKCATSGPSRRSARALSSSSSVDDRSYFPWRHAPTLPDRVLERNDLSGAFNPTTRDPPILRKLIAARELNVSAWDVLPLPFVRHEWEEELASNFAVAFELAMAELLRTLFRVPVKNENGVISIDSSAGSDCSNIDGDEPPSIDDNEYLRGMMDKKLLKRYQIDSQNIRLKFSLQPVGSELQHIFAVPVPGLTREIVEEDPYIRGAIYRLHTAYDENGFDEHYFDLLSDFAKHGPERRTVIAEAAIRCVEFFQIKDAASGTVLRGMEDGCQEEEGGEEVVHIVRFEVVTDGSQCGIGGEREVGNWKITDVDDLLEGNLFH